MAKLTLNKELLKKWAKNLLLFSAPMLAVFFGLLAQGVEIEKAWPVALLALWGALADYFSKLRK